MRFKRELPEAVTKESESDPYYSLKKYTKQLVNKSIDAQHYREILKEHNINPNVEAINKILRQHEGGKIAKFHSLLHTLIKNKDEKFDPTKVEFEINVPKFYKTSIDQDNSNSLLMPSGNGTSQLLCFNKKNRTDSRYNSYLSNKETFDWDANTVKMIKSGEINPPLLDNCTKGVKHIHESHVFDNEKNSSSVNDSPVKRITPISTHHQGTGDILTWKGNMRGENKSSPKKEIVRKNPNVTTHDSLVVEKPKPVKVNRMMVSSEENVLNRKKK